MGKVNSMYQDAFDAALQECEFYNKLGGLNKDVVADIALSHQVNIKDLQEKWDNRP